MFRAEPVVDLLHDVIVYEKRAEKILLGRQIVRHLPRGGEAGDGIDGGGKGFDAGGLFGHADTVAKACGRSAMLNLWVSGISGKKSGERKKAGANPGFSIWFG